MCTNFLLGMTQGNGQPGFINGRSMEFGNWLNSKLFFRAPGHKFEHIIDGYKWTGKYGYVSLNLLNLPISLDGMNSEGLSTGGLWLPGTEYPKIKDWSKTLLLDYVCDWILSSFATCKEVRDALNQEVVQIGEPSLLDKLLPLHFTVHDAQGHSIVIEFVERQIKIHDNPVGVLTNAPFFDWHLENLRNYIGITPWDKPPVEFDQLKVEKTGHGIGFRLIPGDPTPPSRFIRTTMMKTYADSVETLDEATTLAFHILNTVDIPKGINRYRNSVGETESDYTQWVVVKDLTRRILYIRFYDSPQVYSVNLTKINLANADNTELAVPDIPKSIDLSHQVK